MGAFLFYKSCSFCNGAYDVTGHVTTKPTAPNNNQEVYLLPVCTKHNVGDESKDVMVLKEKRTAIIAKYDAKVDFCICKYNI